MSQNMSTATLKKEAGISTCFGWTLGAEKPPHYFVFDLNCGPGENRENGANCLGTGPLIRNKLRDKKIPYHIFLCDISRTAIKKAERHFFSPQLDFFRSMDQAQFVRMDNRLFVPTIAQRIRECGWNPKTAHGIMIADPPGTDVPIREIAGCLKECPLLNVAIHLCGINRIVACRIKRPDLIQMNLKRSVKNLSEIFDTIKMNSWLISEMFGGTTRGTGGHFILYGSYLRWLKEIKGMSGRPDMYPINSPEGKAIIAATDQIVEVA